jgi:3-isopropylmalate/(R)-2-methylmalate dehydratase small subunit
MDALTVLTAIAAPLIRANVDTDAIIPSREMKSVSKTGLSEGLFAGWRYLTMGARDPNPEFILNQPAYVGARILLGGENFGCGSSREHAVWALHEYGFRAVIAPSFAPIFRSNCVRNGIAPVVLTESDISRLAEQVALDPAAYPVTVDLQQCEVRCADFSVPFTMDSESREMLLEGLDAIDLSFKHRDRIDQFMREQRRVRPWLYDLPSSPPKVDITT